MHSKTSETRPSPRFQWKAEPSCDEQHLIDVARQLARELRPGAWVLLEGPMGAGKSTFARALLSGLGFQLPPEGSPTFAIAHDYSEPGMPRTVHLDLYRLENEQELEAAGIHSMFWDSPDSIILSEWTSNWPSLESALLEDPRHDRWTVQIGEVQGDPLRRSISIERIG
jgi:tRNA threonylcarbamoyladenosine biosynthesis protein TsaE